MPFYNCHIHIFSAQCAPKRFLEVGLGKWGVLAAPLKSSLETLVGRTVTGWLSKLSGKKSSQLNNWSRYASFASIGTMSTQEMVFDNILQFYPSDTRFVVLSLNMDYMGAGESDLNFQGQIDQIIDLRKRNPDRILPFLSVDPRMGSAQHIAVFVRKYIGTIQLPGDRTAFRPFIGIKLYPALGFFPFDDRLKDVFKYCEDHGLPIMTHCTPSGAFYVGKLSAAMGAPGTIGAPTNLRLPIRFTDKGNNTETDVFLYPKNWECILQTYPNLKVCFAHMGGSTEIFLNKSKTRRSSWYEDVKELMAFHPNVYTDISYTLANKDTWPEILALCQNRVTITRNGLIEDAPYKNTMGDRVLFGTDYFMTEQEDSEKNLAQKFPNWLLNQNQKHILDKISELNPVAYLTSDFYQP
jgi:uncharacterized protein